MDGGARGAVRARAGLFAPPHTRPPPRRGLDGYEVTQGGELHSFFRRIIPAILGGGSSLCAGHGRGCGREAALPQMLSARRPAQMDGKPVLM